MKKLAFLLAVLLLFSVLPLSGFAAVTAENTDSGDLVADSLFWEGGDGQVIPGTALSFFAVITNAGSADITQPFSVSLLAGTTPLLTTRYEAGLKSGATATVALGKWIATSGDYMMAVCVDFAQTVLESNERNNTYQRNLRVADNRLTSAYESTAEIVQAAGMTDLIFNDDFASDSTVDATATGNAGYKWYLTRPYSAPTLSTDDYSIQDGVMTVKNLIPTYNYGLATVDMSTHTGFSFNTGYLEIRLRIPRPRKNEEGESGIPAIWTLPTQKLFNDSDSQWVEVDWLEYWGDNYGTVCIHELMVDENGTQTQHHQNPNSGFQALGDGKWHVMGWLWQNGLFITYLDGQELMRLSWSEDDYSNPIQTVKKGLPMNGAFVHLDTQTLPIVIGGSADNPLELDWVRVWDGSSDATYVPEKKEEQTSPNIVLTAEEFVYNYTTNSYGEPITTIEDSDSCDNLLAGEAVWHTMTDNRKEEIDALLASQGRSAFATLLVAAKQWQSSTATTTTTINTTANITTTTTTDTVEAPAATGYRFSLWPAIALLGTALLLIFGLSQRRISIQ